MQQEEKKNGGKDFKNNRHDIGNRIIMHLGCGVQDSRALELLF